MAGPLYVTLTDFKAPLQIASSEMDVEITRALGAASRGVEKLTGRRHGAYVLASQPTTRKFTATSCSFVPIDELGHATFTVMSGGTEIEATAEPLNALADEEPFTMLTTAGRFPLARGAIEVTGRWGWPTTPPQVPQFVQIVASKLLKRVREAPFGLITGSFDGEVVRIAREDPDAQFLIEELKRHRVAVG